MLADRIIGRVGADILAGRLANSRQADGRLSDTAALFRLDKLSSTQIASIAREILANPALLAQVDLRIPSSLVEGQGLPDEALTHMNAGAVRNAGTDKEALLTANGNEPNLADTLGHVTALGAKEFRSNEGAWVAATCHAAAIMPTFEDRKVFKAALKGLISTSDLSLSQLADFCAMVSEGTIIQGLAIRDALGWALPWVGLPRDTAFFSNPKTFGQTIGPWKKAFEKLFAHRAPLLARLRPSGQPLDSDEMRLRLIENASVIDDSVRVVLDAFINAPVGADEQTPISVAMLEWERDGVHLIFEKPRIQQRDLADATIHFFDNQCADDDVLDLRWRKHLDELRARERRPDWAEEDDEAFFELHRRYLESDKALHSRWEKAIFGKAIECHDFLDGFTDVAYRLVSGAVESGQERILRLTVTKGRKEWRERFNHDVGAYFSSMYRGIKEIMGSKVEWKVERMGSANLPDPLFQYPAFFARELELQGKIKPCSSLAKAAIQIKFEVALVERPGEREKILDKTQLVWTFRPDSIGLSMVDDMLRLKEKGAVGRSEVPRRVVSKKGGVQSVSLLDTSTLEATYSRDAGSLVPQVAKLGNLRHHIKQQINQLASESRISAEQKTEIREAWDVFESDYIKGLDDFIEIGLHGEAVLRQAESYGALLRALSVHARGDVCRSKLVAEVLSIGTVKVLGEQPCLIIPPWHPERMKALAVKTRRVTGLVMHMLGNNNVLFGDRGIFFREFAEELAHPFYPEIALTHQGGAPLLVSECSTVNGYSLFEPPVRSDNESMTDVDPSAAAKQVRELIERYIGLQPHEATNLSVLLYNTDAAALPLAVVRELSNMQAETGFQCSISVRHRDPTKLRRVYAELVTKSGDDPDSPVASETSDNFISKLRISVSPSSLTPMSAKNGFRAFDIAFLHDAVSRTAGVEWIPVDWTNDRLSLEHAPSRWAYRSVSGENELKSTTFLTCPRQTASGWAYVSAVASVVRQTDAPPGASFLPARRISLQNEALSGTMNDAHALAEWMATYDELLDKRQLQANGVTVVRHRRSSTNGRNMIVSSTSELRLLSVLARRRLLELGLPFTPQQYDAVASGIKKDALSVSGDIVLRAAKRGVSAGEMIGLVLSRYMLEHEFKGIAGKSSQSFSVFFLLDDYAGWLAQKESRIADVLGLCIEERDDGPCLHIAVVECKYVGGDSVAEARRSSKAQLLATMSTFRAALFGDPGRLDRDVWLSRLADMLIDADIPSGCSGLLERARSALRDGAARISLRGYSHVFVHTPNSGAGHAASEQVLIDATEGIQAWQEVFDRPELRSLVEAYAAKANPASIRSKLGPEAPWANAVTRPPADRVAWTSTMERLASSGESVKEPVLEANPVASPRFSAPKKIDLQVAESDRAQEHTSVGGQVSGQATALADTHLGRLVVEKAAAQSDVIDEREAWAEESTRKLKVALNSYGLQAVVLGTRLTPNGCLIRLAGSDKLRVEDIDAKRVQLLTTHAIRLVTVQPKPGEIVVTIEAEKRKSVSLWDLWARRVINRNAAGINTSFVLGLQEINGSLLYLNLGSEFGGLSSHEPHSLVAGATGSGKSVLIQAIMLDIAATNPKDLAHIVLIDPKMGVDYAVLEDLPHMREPIVTTKERATEVLKELVEEMENRYRTFVPARARDLTTFNAKAAPEDKLPMVFLVHDEFADWMLDDAYKTAVGAAVQRLGVKARAAGIHLIFAAQRPDKDVMPMQLRENLGNRLILKVASEATSKIALDRPGAELLLGKGHLAAKLNGEQGLVFAQAPFLSDDDISQAVRAIQRDTH